MSTNFDPSNFNWQEYFGQNDSNFSNFMSMFNQNTQTPNPNPTSPPPASPPPASGGSNTPWGNFNWGDLGGILQGGGDMNSIAKKLQDWFKKGQTPTSPPPPAAPPPPPVPAGSAGPNTMVVPGTAVPGTGQMNVVDYAGNLVNNPSLGLTKDNPATANTNESMFLADHVKGIDENATGTNIDPNAAKYGMDAQGAQAQAGQAATTTSAQVDPRQAQGYDAALSQQNIAQNGQATAQQGQLSQGSQIEAPQLDMQGSATGVNADGSTNYTGQALKEYASQNISNIIDTSTPAGKALAQALGDGNYTDSKATLKGQLDILQSEFVGPNGEPKIPAWAAGTARGVAKIAAFKGMTGSAATAAMAQALMEASIPVAQQDAQFFQTLTIQNLSNKQAGILNRANVLAKFDLTNLDSRMAAAVENAKSFLTMDMANLDNRQQAEVINTQARVQSILEDSKQVNAQRLFTAESANEMSKFYDELNASISQFNTAQTNGMSQFNTGEANSISKFNAEMENAREQFYKNMQFNIDVANAKWRQTVTLTENQQQFEAAATDVKNMVNISQEQLNRIWDRSDAMLDYLWKSAENAADRKTQLAVAKLQSDTSKSIANSQLAAADAAGMGSIFGTVAGKASEALFDWMF